MIGHVVEVGSGRPLPGVAVSDGHDVVRADEHGRWALDVADDAEFVFVTVPSTHLALRDFVVDVRDRSARPPSHVFELAPRPQGAARSFRFAQVTDLHVSVDGGRELRMLQEAGARPPEGVVITSVIDEDELRHDLEELVCRERPDFLAVTGDIANHGQAAELAAYRRVSDALGVPVAHVPGNHDYLSCLNRETIESFGAWWREEGSTRHGLDAASAFRDRVFRADWRTDASARGPWLDEVGPAYYSFDWGGVHVVVYDSEGLLRYGDDYPQDRWLARDLATVGEGTPTVVLLHFSEPASFFATRFEGVRLLASFAGHWHGDRVHLLDGVPHHVTPNIGFAGIDHSPRAYRVVDVDGSRVETRLAELEGPARPHTAAARPARTPRGGDAAWPRRWRAEVGGAPSLGGPLVANGTVVVAVGDEDGGGRLVGLDAADGGRRWDWEAGAAIKHRPTAGGDDVFAITVIGTVVRLDAATGAVRWSTQLGDASHRWCAGAPTVDGHVVYAGGASSFAALDRADGRVLWERADLAADDWMPIRAAPAPADDLVVFAFANEHVQLAAVDVATGATRWLRGGHELTAPWSSPVVHDGRVIVPTIAGWLVARDLATGATCWRSSLGAAWSAATPLVVDDMVLTTSSDGVLHAFDARDGSPRWSSPLGSPWRARLPYGRAPGGSSCSPVRVAADVAVVGPAGEVWRVDLASGELTTVADAEGPVAASPAAGTDTIYVAAEHGVVEAFEAFKAFTP